MSMSDQMSISDRILKFEPGVVYAVRAEYNLEGPGRLDEAIDLLQDWLKKQTHFVKKDFSRLYLEKTLIFSKGSVERAKAKLDKYCSLRTALPNFFNKNNIVKILLDDKVFDLYKFAFLPKMTADYNRIFFVTGDTMNHPNILTAEMITDLYRFLLQSIEYIKIHDYFKSCIFVMDYTQVDVADLAMKVRLADLSQMFTLITEGYGMRLHSFHIVSKSKFVDIIVTLFKKALSPKLGARMRVHDNFDTVYQVVSKEVLPKDVGGEDRQFQEIFNDWIDVLVSDEHVEYLESMKGAITEESYRQTDKYRTEYIGVEGSFRSLNVD